MHFLRFSLQASVCLLSLPFSEARIGNRLAERLGLLKRQGGLCIEDEWYAAVSAQDDSQYFCSVWNSSPNATTTTYFTPTSTSINIRTTSTFTERVYTRVTATITVTPAMKLRRAPAPTERAVLQERGTAADQVMQVFAQVLAGEDVSSISSGNTFAASLFSDVSSACGCLSQGPLYTETVTSTDPPNIKVVTAYTVKTYEVESSSTVRTVTVTASPSSRASSTVTSVSTVVVTPVPAPSDAPLGYNYNCPADNNTTQRVVVGSNVYSFLVFCNSSFTDESSIASSPATKEGDCLAQCAQADGAVRAPLCKGFSFDGVSCSLYSTALSGKLVSTNGVDSAILLAVKGTNTTFQNRTAGASEASSVIASITRSGVTMITPPPSSTYNSTAGTSCFASTSTFSNGAESWTSVCASSYAWYGAWESTATIIYSTEAVFVVGGSGGGSNGAGGSGGAGGGSDGASGSAGQTITMATATATGGSGAESTGTGAIIGTGGAWSSAWSSAYTTVVSGSTFVTTVTGGASGGGSGFNGTGGVVVPTGGSGNGSIGTGGAWSSAYTSAYTTIVSGSTFVTTVTGGAGGEGSGSSGTGGGAGSTAGSGSGSTGTGSVLFPDTSTVTTIIGESTITYITSGATSAEGSGSTGTGGVISQTASNISTAIGGITSGGGSGSTGTGGVILPTGGNFTTTIINATTLTIINSGASSGATAGSTGTGGVILSSMLGTINSGAISGGGSGSTGTGGVITPTANSTGPVFYSTFFNATVTTAVSSGETSGGGETATGTGGVILPTSNGTFSRTTSEKPRSGTASPPESETTQPPYGSWTPSYNFSIIIPGTGTGGSGESSTGTGGVIIPTSDANFSRSATDKPRSGSQTPLSSGPSSGFPYPTPNSTWLGETHPGPTTTPPVSQTWTPYPGFNTTIPTSSGTAPTIDTDTFSRSASDKPRSGSQSPSGPSSGFPYPSPNSTWLGETHAGPTTSTPLSTVSGSPTPSPNSTYCATTTIRETVTETIYTESCPGICITSDFASYGLTYTAMTSSTPTPTTSPTTTFTTASSSVTSLPQLRQPGEPATQADIDSSCAFIGNQIFNGEFELKDSNSNPLGWGFSRTSPKISFLSSEDPAQHTDGGSRNGRIESTNSTAIGRIYQPLTLCPNTKYSLMAWTKQPRVLAECSAVFNLGGVEIGRVSPGQVWSSAASGGMTFTVGTNTAVDFEIGVNCRGSGDSGGKRVILFDDLDLSAVLP
ncbi:hypothetical protein EJ08DRAFT_730904 [Tothia fuscella]|uniref:Apple domain-containing protein n=1 Tax=Tothia fuscella TaxID=1048955 RepID=A0A9P4NYY8_9PEZI|nr:hypothetical protein EJ08DRAFT_730904 [Tothia fuscella]